MQRYIMDAPICEGFVEKGTVKEVMMLPALVLVIVGFVLAGGGFIFAAVNMARAATGKKEQAFNFETFFGKHIGAMIVTGCGSLLFFFGLFLAVMQILIHISQR